MKWVLSFGVRKNDLNVPVGPEHPTVPHSLLSNYRSLYSSPCTAKRMSSEENWLQDKNLGDGLRLCPLSRIIVTGFPWGPWPSQSQGLVQITAAWMSSVSWRGAYIQPESFFYYFQNIHASPVWVYLARLVVIIAYRIHSLLNIRI